MAPATSAASPLFTALGRLDRILDRARRAADAAYGASASTDPYRGLYVSADDVDRILTRDPGAPLLAGQELNEPVPEFPALHTLSTKFDLPAFDQDVILLALAPEIDTRYEKLFGYLHDDVSRRRPSVDLALNLLCASREAKLAARARFAPNAPLLKRRLVQLIPDASSTQPPLLSHALKLDDAVVRRLVGQHAISERASQFAELLPLERPADSGNLSTTLIRLENLARDAAQAGGPGLIVYFEGPRQSGKRKAAEILSSRLNQRLLTASIARMPEQPQEFEDALDLLLREAALNDAALYIERLDDLRETARAASLAALHRLLGRATGLVILDGARAWGSQELGVAVVAFPALDHAGRTAAWQRALDAERVPLPETTVEELAALYRLNANEIERSVSSAAQQARLDGRKASGDDFFAAARSQSARDLGALAQKVSPVYTWDDLVLPPDSIAQLREITNQARYRQLVFDKWGFEDRLSTGKGIAALFAGPPGTGKTMAAEVIASDLRLDLFKIDLSQVVSKYIGETEKNLSKVFELARESNSILFFDECDALFGKRSEVKDAHDRYANIEVAYLLQKIDEYDGLCILATNLRQNLDPAFTRRLTFILEFPFPDEASRRRIWNGVFPTDLPRSRDLDLDYLARQLKLSGGSVRNIAVASAFLAAADPARQVSMAHVLRAARRELEKMGRAITRAELGHYADQQPEIAAAATAGRELRQ
ncbi:MAG: ATP-binding protein [Bryobacteraceae bacterium]|nr:ATP-binding protein [Bryobacteraceae bacterium]